MTNFSDISSFDINTMVAKKLGFEVEEMQTESPLGMTPDYHRRYPNTIWACDGKSAKEQLCFTHNIEDWPILMVNNDIALTPKWRGADLYHAVVVGTNHYAVCDLPGRAVAIAYLKSKSPDTDCSNVITAYCVSCQLNLVDVSSGQDTCRTCIARQ